MMLEDLSRSQIRGPRQAAVECLPPWQDSKEFLTSTSLSPNQVGKAWARKACLKMKTTTVQNIPYILIPDLHQLGALLALSHLLRCLGVSRPVLFPFLSLSLVQGVHAHVRAHVPEPSAICQGEHSLSFHQVPLSNSFAKTGLISFTMLWERSSRIATWLRTGQDMLQSGTCTSLSRRKK